MSDFDENQPPNNPELERAVLSDMLHDPEAFAAGVSELGTEDFYCAAHGKVYRALSSLFSQQSSVDVLALQQQLRIAGDLDDIGGSHFIARLVSDHISSAAYRLHFEMLREFTLKRALLKLSYEIQTQALDPGLKAKNSISQLTAKLHDLQIAREANIIKKLGDTTLLELDYFQKLKAVGGTATLKTGLRALDKVTGGLSKEYVILASRPSLGKTAISQAIATNIARQQSGTVLFFSAEMSAEQLARRQLASSAGLNLGFCKDVEYLNEGELAKAGHTLVAQMPTLNKVLIDDTPRVTPSHILLRARQIKARYPDLCLIVIDYIQIMQSDFSYKSRREEISAVSAQLKAISRIMSVPLLALSQLSREPEKREDKKPQLADLREDGSLEQDCDMAWLLFRKSFYFNVPADERNILQIHVAKNRQGQRGVCEVYFDESSMRVCDLHKRPDGHG